MYERGFVSGGKKGRLTLEVGSIRNCLVTGPWASRASKGWPAKIPTNGRVDDQLVLEKVLLHVANGCREERSRSAPSGRVWLPGLDVRRDVVAEETPHLNTGRVPEVGVDTAPTDVELATISLFLCVTEATASVVQSATATYGMDEN